MFRRNSNLKKPNPSVNNFFCSGFFTGGRFLFFPWNITGQNKRYLSSYGSFCVFIFTSGIKKIITLAQRKILSRCARSSSPDFFSCCGSRSSKGIAKHSYYRRFSFFGFLTENFLPEKFRNASIAIRSFSHPGMKNSGRSSAVKKSSTVFRHQKKRSTPPSQKNIVPFFQLRKFFRRAFTFEIHSGCSSFCRSFFRRAFPSLTGDEYVLIGIRFRKRSLLLIPYALPPRGWPSF